MNKEWLLNGEDLTKPEPDISAGDPAAVSAWLRKCGSDAKTCKHRKIVENKCIRCGVKINE